MATNENLRRYAMEQYTQEIQYFLLLFTILILPKALLRFRIPTALTCLTLGFVTATFLGWFQNDQLLLMLSRLGITSLFLFAGLEVELDELKEDAGVLMKHTLKIVLLIMGTAAISHYIFDVGFRISVILALGLMTPSTGFILNSLKSFSLNENQQRWVRSKAISKELIAIFLMFVVLQSESAESFGIASFSVLFMIIALPVIFKFFLRVIAPFAPDSEASFLILIALLCGVLTMKLGTYYLVGAFIVGMTAGRFKHFMHHEKSDNMLYSLSLFFSFFIPFYFFRAGLTFPSELLDIKGLLVGLLFLVVFLPLRFFMVLSSIWFFMRESWSDRMAIAIPLLPTLIFGLVIANILHSRLEAPSYLVSGLIVYTLGASILPWFFLKRTPPSDYDLSMIR